MVLGEISKYIVIGGRNFVKLPRHIYEIVDIIQIELQKQSRLFPDDKYIATALKSIKTLRKKISPEMDISSMIDIVQQIIEISRVLSIKSIEPIYKEVEIETELLISISYAHMTHPKMKEELDVVQDLIDGNSNWNHYGSQAKFKLFKLVRSEKSWQKVMVERDGIDLGNDPDNNMFQLKYLKVGYVTNRSDLQVMEEVKQKLILQGNFKRYEKAFNVLFGNETIGTYYIYVPK